MDKKIDYNAAYTAVRVAQDASFVRASERLRIPVSTVSARVKSLESSLGVQLFRRSTRRVRLTEAGEAFLEHARRGSEGFDDAVLAATRLLERPRGLLRVVAPALFARHLLPRFLPRFIARFPDVTVSIEAVNMLPDLTEHGADVGIGVGPARWSAYTRRSLASFSQAVYASPQYLARWGSPARPEDLMAGPLLVVGVETKASWLLVSGSRRAQITVSAHISVSDVSAVHALALAGTGAALLPQQLCENDIAAGALVRLIPEWATPPVQLSAYYPKRQLEPGKVKAFLAHLIEWFANHRGK